MKIYFSPKAAKGLEKIYAHVTSNFSPAKAQLIRDQIVKAISKIGDFPEIGAKIGGQTDKRVLYVAGNSVVYEIFLKKDPFIVVRNIRPRKTKRLDLE